MNAQEVLIYNINNKEEIISFNKEQAMGHLEKGNIDMALDHLRVAQIYRRELTAIIHLGSEMGLDIS